LNLTEIIFVLSTYLITFLIVSVVRFFLELPPPGSDDTGMERDIAKSALDQSLELEKKKLKKKGWRDYLHTLFIILPNLIISAILTYFTYKFYPFEPTIPNIVTIIGSFFGVFVASYFIYKSF